MKIDIINRQATVSISKARVKEIVTAVLLLENRTCDEVAIHFIESKEMCDLHEKFFNDPSPTDCISFPMDSGDEEGYSMLGEVFVCPATAVEYAKNNDTELSTEITLYVIHGLLHLLGYDDIQEKDRLKMRRAEKRNIANLNFLNI